MFEAFWGFVGAVVVTVIALYSVSRESKGRNEARMPKWHLYLSFGATPIVFGMALFASVARPPKADPSIIDALVVWSFCLGYPYLCYRLFNKYRKTRLIWSEDSVSFTNEKTTIQFEWEEIESVSYWPRRSLFVILLDNQDQARVPAEMTGIRAFCHALKNHVHESRLERAKPGFRMLSLQ